MITPIIAGFVPQPLLLLSMLLPLLWLVAEIRWKVWLRIFFGSLSIAVMTLVVSETRLIMPTYTIGFLQSAIMEATTILKHGDSRFVLDTFEAYQQRMYDQDDYTSAGDLERSLQKKAETLRASNRVPVTD